jgi:Skp family chaperone for outer membrane proteins
MPEANSLMVEARRYAVHYLVVDMTRILDDSAEGRAAAADLGKRWSAARRELASLSERAAAGDESALARMADLEANFPQAIAKEKRQMQAELTKKARAVIAQITADRGVDLVFAAEHLLAHGATAEITEDVIHALDEAR